MKTGAYSLGISVTIDIWDPLVTGSSSGILGHLGSSWSIEKTWFQVGDISVYFLYI